MKNKEGQNNIKIIKRFLPYYKPYRGVLCLDLLCAAISSACDLVLPIIARQITERATESIDSLTVGFVLRCTLVYLIFRIISTAAGYYTTANGHIMGAKIETDMRRDFFNHLQRLSFSFYDNTKVGQLMSRISSDLFDVTEFSHHCPEEIFTAATIILTSFVVLITINIPLTLIIFAMLPVLYLCLSRSRKRMKINHRDSRKKIGELNAQVEDSLLGVRVVKSFNNEEVEISKFKGMNEAFLQAKKRIYLTMGSFDSISKLGYGIMYILVVCIGGLFIINRSISAADLIAYLLYLSTLLNSIRRIIDFTEQFQRGITGIERFCEICDIEPEIKDSPNARALPEIKGEIDFCDVCFSYGEDSKTVLNNINLSVKQGENIAIIGPSGAGKTTICSLIPRFYDIDEGEIKIDGEDIRNIPLSQLRQSIGIVQQDVYLFSGTVKENILYGKPNASDEEVLECAKQAGAYEFIKALPQGFDTYVGERGVKLSGGQKQRISIARVFLKNPPILILDEATSSLDNESEKRVQQSIELLAKGRTTLTIAHRLTTIKNADRVVLLTENGIEKIGSYQEVVVE